MRVTSFLPLAVVAAAPLILAAQLPFRASTSSPSSSEDFHITHKHPSHPAHSLRIAQPKASLCERNDKATSWSGYLDVDLDKLWEHNEAHGIQQLNREDHPKGITEHFYFWAFESRGSPSTDPVMLWLNGGPGCSSFTGLLMELGPCNAANNESPKGPHTEWNPWSWTNNATMVFLDQPIGVGYSYSAWTNGSKMEKAPARTYDTPSAARDTSAFLHLLALHAKDVFGGSGPDGSGISSFHMAGESYAGRYLPLLAHQVLEDNEEAIAHPERGVQPLPLASILIGNGITSPKDQYPAYVSYACDNKYGFGNNGSFYDKKTCDDLKDAIPTCLALVDKCNKNGPGSDYDLLACKSALDYCEGKLSEPWTTITKSSPYNWNHSAEYEEENWVAAFLNDHDVKVALGVDGAKSGDKHDGTFIGCSDAVGKQFEKTGDGARESTWAVKSVLEKGTRVLAYSGQYDWICNTDGNSKWTYDLEWSGGDDFRNAPTEEWYTLGQEKSQSAGLFKNSGLFTYAEVKASGHFVPHDQPEAALSMLNFWLHGSQPGRLEP